MATITRGKRKGEEVTIHQFCNDWFTTGDGAVLSPLSLQLNEEEMVRVEQARIAGQTGTMFYEYEMTEDGRFKRTGRQYP